MNQKIGNPRLAEVEEELENPDTPHLEEIKLLCEWALLRRDIFSYAKALRRITELAEELDC
jgi:hypothetical protein